MPVQHSEYVESAVELLVEPVLRAVNQLHVDSQISAMTLAITAFCEAWSSSILARKIRFRYVSDSVGFNVPLNTL